MEQDFGQLVGIASADIMQDSDLPADRQQERKSVISTETNPLWEYGVSGTINGIRVADADKDLPIEGMDVLYAAFELHTTPKLLVCWISPDTIDSIERYEQLLADVEQHKAVITDEDRQYDQGKSAYMLLVRYDEVEYRLHPRFNYLREERDAK